MTKFSHKEASEQIARIYGVNIKLEELTGCEFNTFTLKVTYQTITKYITQDLGALMELAIRNFIMVDPIKTHAVVGDAVILVEEAYADHNNDPIEATRVAIAKALIKKGGE